jgi:UDP-2,4-diacetamido-2,4,6-trideoxy-beta-L-altropyranose hydrolase
VIEMNVVIRTDASLEIGTGHVMRCITLAKQLKREGANITFVCRNFPGNSISFIQSQGFHVYSLSFSKNQNHGQWIRDNWQKDAEETKQIIQNLKKKTDLLIVDHYGLDSKWENDFRKTVTRIMVIDDLADRSHDCDLLLDQNYYLDMQNRYIGLIPDTSIQLLGPDYVLLRDEFLSINLKEIKRDGKINNILVFFGGTDPTGETLKALQAIQELNRIDIEFNVVVGASNLKKVEIKKKCEQMSNVTFFCQVSNMAELMMKADLAIGAGGTTSWERCYLGLPSILIIVADNQKEVTQAIAQKGAALLLGESSLVSDMVISKVLNALIGNLTKLYEMMRRSWKIVNPNIVKEQLVTKKIMELLK